MTRMLPWLGVVLVASTSYWAGSRDLLGLLANALEAAELLGADE
jgi:hypothetical protein